jgi:hypothetical protein
VLLAGVMAMVLAACSDSSEPTGGTNDDAETEETEAQDKDKEQEKELTAEEVYEKALEASENLESAEVKMDMQQTMEAGDGSGSMKTDSKFDTEMTMDPLAMHMKGVTKMEMEGADEDMPDMDMEIYMVDGAMYLYSEQIGDWMKMDGASMDAIEDMAGQQPDPSEQLEMVKDYTNDMDFEEKDNAYVLKLDTDGEKFNELMQEMIEENMPEELLEQMGEEGQEALDNMKIHSMSMEYVIDKETFDISSMTVNMDMTMKAEDEELHITQTVKADYANINGVDAIEVPEDVKENAIEQ